jgi:hypothetical protein
MYQSMDAIKEHYLDGQFDFNHTVSAVVDQLIEEDQLEYDDVGLPDFMGVQNQAIKIINRWKVDFRSENPDECY